MTASNRESTTRTVRRVAGIGLLMVAVGLLSWWSDRCGLAGSTGGDQPTATQNSDPTDQLTLAAYTAPREAFGQIIPAFAQQWKTRTGRTVTIRESYLGSGAQARAVAAGFEADVVALSMAPDVELLVKAKLVRPDWAKASPHSGIVTRSVVVAAVRSGNPKAIHGWADLTRPDVELLVPDARMSGAARWIFVSAIGAAQRGRIPGYSADAAGAERFAADLLARVLVLDKGARESIISFEKGLGDAALTYESEALTARRLGRRYDYVVLDSSVSIENPAVVVDEYADRHGRRAVADAFVEFLHGPTAQAVFAEHGFRFASSSAVDAEVARRAERLYTPPRDLFSVRELGGWAEVGKLFQPNGLCARSADTALRRR